MVEENWKSAFKRVYDKGMAAYRAGNKNPRTWWAGPDLAFLQGIGCGVTELFDFIDDLNRHGEPDYRTALELAALRKAYLEEVLHGKADGQIMEMGALPAKSDSLGGIPWLPRLIEKARAKLEGRMPDDLMYCCGGDRGFFAQHGLTAEGFLKEAWRVNFDSEALLQYVRSRGKLNHPAAVSSSP